MKFTLSWLKDHLETEAPLDDILTALTDLGHEVEGVENPEASLGAFRIVRVIEAVPHPNADRLRLCRVETFPDGPGGRAVEVQVVCGAPNARTGLIGVFAWGRDLLGLSGVTGLVAAFPALMMAYLWSVRGRTAADHEKMALNEKHFLPHQGVYFGGGAVVRVNWTKRELNLREQVEARHAEVTKRRG